MVSQILKTFLKVSINIRWPFCCTFKSFRAFSDGDKGRIAASLKVIGVGNRTKWLYFVRCPEYTVLFYKFMHVSGISIVSGWYKYWIPLILCTVGLIICQQGIMVVVNRPFIRILHMLGNIYTWAHFFVPFKHIRIPISIYKVTSYVKIQPTSTFLVVTNVEWSDQSRTEKQFCHVCIYKFQLLLCSEYWSQLTSKKKELRHLAYIFDSFPIYTPNHSRQWNMYPFWWIRHTFL